MLIDRMLRILGLLLAASTAWAAVPQAGEKLADMAQFIHYLRPEPRADSKEAFEQMAADEAADGLTSASRLAFLGGLRLQAERHVTTPGISDTVTLPLPASLGGTKSAEVVLLPRVQNIYSLGWTLPLFNMQAISGLRVAARTREQQQAVQTLEREAVVRTKINILLRYALAQRARELKQEQLAVSQSRLDTVLSRFAAGLAREGQKNEAEASLAGAKAELAEAETTIQSLSTEFHLHSGETLPQSGLGLPSFPFVPERPFNPIAVTTLNGIADIHEATASVQDAAFAPTVSATAAREYKQYERGPAPQNAVGVQVSWTLLDGGSRRRNTSDERRAMFQAKADAADTQLQMQTSYQTLTQRHLGAEAALKARQAASTAAYHGVQDALSAYSSGSGRLLDVSNADDQLITTELQAFKAQIDLQSIAVESLVLSGSLVPFIENGGHL